MPASQPDAVQIGKIAARIESTHDGEALAAARMLVKRLGGHGLRLADVVERGVSGGKPAQPFNPLHSFRASYPPFPAHWTKIDALLDDPTFMGEYLTRRSLDRLQALRRAATIDAVTMSWIDGLLEKARELRAGRAA